MLSMGSRILPTSSLSNLQVLSWVWSGSVTETRKRINDEARSWKIPSLTHSRSTLASASILSMILILRSSSFCWSSGFYIRRQSNSLWNFSSLFQCLIYGFLVSNIYKSSLVAPLTSPSYSKTVSSKDKSSRFESEKSGWHVRGACGIWRLWLGHC